MSRVGNKPVPIPSGVKVELNNGVISVAGPKGNLGKNLPPLVDVKIEKDAVSVLRNDDTQRARAMHGLARSLIAGMFTGVVQGFKKELEIVGIGYRAQVGGAKLTLNLGFSHPVVYQVPSGVKVSVFENTRLTVEGADKQLVGEVAAIIRRFRKPEPYKGKGIRYVGEHITIKEGKTVT